MRIHCRPLRRTCEAHTPLVFIEEITARAFIVADSNKRRTLSRSDIAKALSKSDQFDFLIDIVPRELGMPSLPSHGPGGSSEGKRTAAVHATVGPSSGGAGNVVKYGEVRCVEHIFLLD